jgi:hypothetical protein
MKGAAQETTACNSYGIRNILRTMIYVDSEESKLFRLLLDNIDKIINVDAQVTDVQSK